MRIECIGLQEKTQKQSEALVLGLLEGQKSLKDCSGLLEASLLGKIEKYISRDGFALRKNEILTFDVSLDSLQRLYVIVLGKDLFLESARQACGRIMDLVRGQGHQGIQIFGDSFKHQNVNVSDLVEAMAEALDLADYHYAEYKPQDKKSSVKTIEFVFKSKGEAQKLQASVELGRKIAEGVNFTRDLVNTPANQLPPRVLSDRAQAMAKEFGISFKAYDKKGLEKMKMGGILAVSQGSVEEPRLIVLEYGDKSKPVDYVFCGKGVTFDSGGISIKPSDGMEKMKYDMAGGAAVIGILRTAANLRLKQHIVGLIPAAENMPSGSATRPGDIIWMGSGKSVEVLNTDAEGRLLLGDALFYAQQYKPKAVIDLATLTGAVVVALGTVAIGALGNNANLIEKIKKSGESSGERVWELPLWDDYYEQIKGEAAEIRNIGGKGGGTITAAMFLKQFVNYPWVHLDIAGTAWADEKRPYFQKGSTGVGVRLLVNMLRNGK